MQVSITGIYVEHEVSTMSILNVEPMISAFSRPLIEAASEIEVYSLAKILWETICVQVAVYPGGNA